MPAEGEQEPPYVRSALRVCWVRERTYLVSHFGMSVAFVLLQGRGLATYLQCEYVSRIGSSSSKSSIGYAFDVPASGLSCKLIVFDGYDPIALMEDVSGARCHVLDLVTAR